MIKIENFLANENSEFLNYRFDQEHMYFLNMKENDIDNFWSFLTENKNFSLGDLIVEDTLITGSGISSTIRRTVLDQNTFFVDDGLWYRQKTSAYKLLKELVNFKNVKDKFILDSERLLNYFLVKKQDVEKPYKDLDEFTKIILDIVLMILVNKRYNFFLYPNWNELEEVKKQFIIKNLNKIAIETNQIFIFVTKQKNPDLLDINNKTLTTSNEITIFSKDYKKVNPKKRNSFKSFTNLSKIIFSMFRLPYTISMIVMFLFLFLTFLFVYSSNKIIPYNEAKYVILSFLILTFLMLCGFVWWCVPYFEKYKHFVKTQPIPYASKITYFCYTNLIQIFVVLFSANILSWLISTISFKVTIDNIYVSYSIFINLGFLIINLVLLALWILLYNRNNFKHSLRR